MASLGHVVSKDDIQVDLKKIKAAIDWPRPTIITEVRSFLFIKLLHEIGEGFLQDSSALDQANSEKY